MQFAVNFLAKAAATEGTALLMKTGGFGAVAGAGYGAVSDRETIMSGAFKGALLGGAGGYGAKRYGTNMIANYNARVAAGANVMADGVQSLSTSKGSYFSGTKNIKVDNEFLSDMTQYKHGSAFYNSVADGPSLSDAFASNVKLNKNWFSDTIDVDDAAVDSLKTSFKTLEGHIQGRLAHNDPTKQQTFKDFANTFMSGVTNNKFSNFTMKGVADPNNPGSTINNWSYIDAMKQFNTLNKSIDPYSNKSLFPKAGGKV